MDPAPKQMNISPGLPLCFKKFTMGYAVFNFHRIFVTVVTKIGVDYGLIFDPLTIWTEEHHQ